MQVEIKKAEKELADFKKVQLYAELGDQMKEAEMKKRASDMERRDKICTTGGPTQNVEDVGLLKTKFQNQKLLVKLNLEKQMQME